MSYQQDLGTDWGALKEIGGAIGGAAVNVYTARAAAKTAASQAAAAQAMAMQQPPSAPSAGMPAWLLPVGIGAAALVLILVLKKRS